MWNFVANSLVIISFFLPSILSSPYSSYSSYKQQPQYQGQYRNPYPAYGNTYNDVSQYGATGGSLPPTSSYGAGNGGYGIPAYPLGGLASTYSSYNQQPSSSYGSSPYSSGGMYSSPYSSANSYSSPYTNSYSTPYTNSYSMPSFLCTPICPMRGGYGSSYGGGGGGGMYGGGGASPYASMTPNGYGMNSYGSSPGLYGSSPYQQQGSYGANGGGGGLYGGSSPYNGGGGGLYNGGGISSPFQGPESGGLFPTSSGFGGLNGGVGAPYGGGIGGLAAGATTFKGRDSADVLNSKASNSTEIDSGKSTLTVSNKKE